MRIDGKVVLITGASGGIGAACAAEFAKAGAKLSLTGRTEEALQQAGGPEALVTRGDLTREDVRVRVVERTLQKFGRIDVLINSAGIGSFHPAWSMPIEQVHEMIDLNFFSLLRMIQLVVPQMREQKEGLIVNMGSVAGKMTLPWHTVYSASKFAVGSLTEGLRMELRRDGIRTLLVCPGYVTSKFQEHVLAGKAPDEVVKARRFAISPAQCAKAIRKGVEADKRTIVTPRVFWFMVLAARMLPGKVEERLAKMNGTA